MESSLSTTDMSMTFWKVNIVISWSSCSVFISKSIVENYFSSDSLQLCCESLQVYRLSRFHAGKTYRSFDWSAAENYTQDLIAFLCLDRCVTQHSWAMVEGRFVMSPSLTICSWKFAVKARLLYLFFRVDHLKIRNVYLDRRLEIKKGDPNRRIRAWVQRIGKHEHTSSIASRIKDRFKIFFKLWLRVSKLL